MKVNINLCLGVISLISALQNGGGIFVVILQKVRSTERNIYCRAYL